MIKILILLVVLISVGVILLLAKLAKRQTKGATYFLREALFTRAEIAFLQALEPILPPHARVFGKVRLEDFIGVRPNLTGPAKTSARNRINRKHIDFLIVDRMSLKPLLALELDDKSHQAQSRQNRDEFVDETYQDAGLPVLHVKAAKTYDPNELKTLIETKIGS